LPTALNQDLNLAQELVEAVERVFKESSMVSAGL